jgi:hypothetical protein
MAARIQDQIRPAERATDIEAKPFILLLIH